MDPTLSGAADFVNSYPLDATSGGGSWMDSLMNGLGSVVGTAGSTLSNIYGAQANAQAAQYAAQVQASTVAAQQAYMAQSAQTAGIMSAGNTRQYMIYGVGVLLFLIALRQTRQA